METSSLFITSPGLKISRMPLMSTSETTLLNPKRRPMKWPKEKVKVNKKKKKTARRQYQLNFSW